jgi:hypothetical protein
VPALWIKEWKVKEKTMFKAYYREDGWKLVTVYAVDFNHDAFLINHRGEFKWKPMDNFCPVNEDEDDDE